MAESSQGSPALTKPRSSEQVVERLRLPDDFDRPVLHQLFLSREAAGSTAVGEGIAIPHPRHPVIMPTDRPTLTLFFLDSPIDFGARDGQPVHTLFVLISPTIRAHLRMLARIACALRDEQFRAVLKRRGSNEEILREVRAPGRFHRSPFERNTGVCVDATSCSPR